ncbi:type I-U CRISPR-associated protein Cas5/Cas6 [Actinomyces sp. 2119]|uniref:type I-G CRISPR-associated protein Csb2 n=1 Tax=Actinomyces sp. 2119 TaxID=2321393 RepID=UPI000E6D0734|nr:type I-U CRISPR-associated protein Csb2 [Actinomyces sp. 2119]RJF41163.1 type I-U CRISPR-associated protein Cas5/Cas6 [Actinomyces sp. 2119]
MTSLTVTARFPTGQFNAHDAEGWPEWPPAPARLAAALLAAAHSSGTGVDVVERFFAAAPPRVTAPAAGARDVRYRRWVPVNNEVSLGRTGKNAGKPVGIVDANKRFGEKSEKDSERGMLVGHGHDDVVRWFFEDAPVAGADLGTLTAVARAVTYLGRPTSPVLLDVVAGDDKAPGNHDRWEPDEDGPLRLRVATMEYLAALDAREERRRQSRVTGTHPGLDVRPTWGYRLYCSEEGTWAAGRPRGNPVDAALYRFPGGRLGGVAVYAADAAMVVDQIREQVPELVSVLPLFGWVSGSGQREVPVLRGVAVWATSVPRPLQLAVRSGVVEARPTEPRALSSLPRVVRAATQPSHEWTSVVPVTATRDAVERSLSDLAASLRTRVCWAGLHSEARPEVGSDVHEPDVARHVTVRFRDTVPGPVVLNHTWMVPAGATGLAVNAKRPHRRTGSAS